jgi:hypothetical protein
MRGVIPIVVLAASLAGCHKKTDASRENFTQAIRTYLERRGDLCVAKYAWPIDVPEVPARPGARDAVQMPVLEKLGIVTSSAAVVDAPSGRQVRVMRYELTEEGRKCYIARPGEPDGQKDLCVAHLSLDKVVSWDTSRDESGEHVVVSYTYRVEAPPWVRDAEAQRVFPAVARLLQGAGSAELKETLTLATDGWVANELLAPAKPIASRPPAPGNP